VKSARVPVEDPVGLVHHADDVGLVGGVQRSHRDVAHGTELAAVVQVLVLQAEEVPDEPSVQYTGSF
jgi:hypothetical protein